MKFHSIVLVALASTSLAACAVAPVPPPQASMENIQAVRAGGFAPMRVGEFTPGPGAPSQMDKKVTVRAGSQAAPSGSYAKLLGETLEAELKGAGKLDPNAALTVSGVLTQTHVDSAMPDGSAKLEAHFTLKKNGAVAFDKTLAVDSTWKSGFIGAVAIPDAFNHYNGLFPQLVSKLLADPDFKAAAKAG
ncbi:MAG TPA: hypothetical protein VGH86_02015 [Phenylobacterium sp.]|jgi:hypothetical protein